MTDETTAEMPVTPQPEPVQPAPPVPAWRETHHGGMPDRYTHGPRGLWIAASVVVGLLLLLCTFASGFAAGRFSSGGGGGERGFGMMRGGERGFGMMDGRGGPDLRGGQDPGGQGGCPGAQGGGRGWQGGPGYDPRGQQAPGGQALPAVPVTPTAPPQ